MDPKLTTHDRCGRQSYCGKGHTWGRSALLVAVIGAIMVGSAGGCRGKAYRDIYTEKLTNRVRVLEDELNAAEYEIKVLRDQIDRERSEELDGSQSSSKASGRSVLGFPRPQESESSSESMRNGSPPKNDAPQDRQKGRKTVPTVPSLEDLDIDAGQLMEDSVSPGLIPSESPSLSPPGLSAPEVPEILEAFPPTQPIPPSTEDLLPPPIDLGDPAPPSGGDGQGEELPPGKITTPNTARSLIPPEPSVPKKIAFHPGLTGRHLHDSDDIVDGVYAVLTLEDQYGQLMRTSAPISFVMLDPNRDGEDARIGRWDLTADEIQAALRESPLTSFQIPLLWKNGKRPTGNEVAIFVRAILPSGEKLETEMLLELNTQVAQEWKPQGLGTGLVPMPKNATLPSGLLRNDVWR